MKEVVYTRVNAMDPIVAAQSVLGYSVTNLI